MCNTSHMQRKRVATVPARAAFMAMSTVLWASLAADAAVGTTSTTTSYVVKERVANCGDSIVGSNVGEPDLYQHTLNEVGDSKVLVEPKQTMRYTFDACRSGDYDTFISLHNVDDPLRPLDANDDACGLASKLTYTLTAGQRYYLLIGGYSHAGNWHLSVRCDDDDDDDNDNDDDDDDDDYCVGCYYYYDYDGDYDYDVDYFCSGEHCYYYDYYGAAPSGEGYGVCGKLTPISPEECTQERVLLNCVRAAYGELCEGDGECGTDQGLDNCNTGRANDVYLKERIDFDQTSTTSFDGETRASTTAASDKESERDEGAEEDGTKAGESLGRDGSVDHDDGGRRLGAAEAGPILV